MHHSKQVKLQQQIKFLRSQFLQGSNLPLSDVLSQPSDHASFDSYRFLLEAKNLLANGDALGLSWASTQCRSFLSVGSGDIDR